MRISILLVLCACGVSVEQRAANVAEAAGYAAELAECRRLGRLARADGGAEAYMRAYEDCASKADEKHGLTASEAGGR